MVRQAAMPNLHWVSVMGCAGQEPLRMAARRTAWVNHASAGRPRARQRRRASSR